MMKGFIAFVVAGGAFAAGCHEPVAPAEPTRASVNAPGEAEFDRLWAATLRVLRQHNFRPARQDRRAGVIETLPTTAQHWFEFWRKDTIGPYEHAESNLHTLRKFVIVKVARTDQPGRYTVDVEVEVERLSQPERQITSASGALRTFSETVPTRQGVFPGKPTWIPLGRDGKMEGYLLGKILVRYGEPVELEASADAGKISTDRENDQEKNLQKNP